MMKPREVGGRIREAKAIYVYIWLTEECGYWQNISQTQARDFVDAAKDEGCEEVLAFIDKKGDLYLGDDEESLDEGEGEGEEETDETSEEEEEEEEGEEEAPEEEQQPKETAPKPRRVAPKRR